MKPVKEYASAGALRRALEDRLRQAASVQQIDLARLRRQVAFDRLLARLFHSAETLWALKGGYAMELRLRVARTTVDIDLTLPANPTLPSEVAAANVTVREMLQNAAILDLGDCLSTPLAHQSWISTPRPTAEHAIPSSAAWTEESSRGSISMSALATS